MADEADILQSNNLEYRQVTVADGSAFPIGSLLILTTDPNTADLHRGSSVSTQYPAGFCAVEKTASDGQTTLPVLVRGDVDAVASDSIAIGQLVCLGVDANRLRAVGALSVEKMGAIVGRCLETATAGEKVRIRLLLG